MYVLGFFYTFFLYIIFFYIFTFIHLFFACNSAFEQGHLEPWRYINAFIIIIIIIIIIIYPWTRITRTTYQSALPIISALMAKCTSRNR